MIFCRVAAVPEGASFFCAWWRSKICPEILMLQDSRRGACGLEKQIDADGEIRAIQETGPALFDQLSHFVQVAIPAGGPHHHVLAGADAGLDISQDSLRAW